MLIAEHQTAGRGRSGRTWSAAPRAQLTLSVGVDAADVPTPAWGWLPLAAGLAVVDAVEAACGVQAALKWPNDVLAGDGKLAGILSEVAGQTIVVGIGLNVTLRADEVDEPLVTSLTDLGVAAPDRTALAAEVLRRFGERVTGWRAGDLRLMDEYRSRCTTIGSSVRALLPGGREVVGTARSGSTTRAGCASRLRHRTTWSRYPPETSCTCVPTSKVEPWATRTTFWPRTSRSSCIGIRTGNG